MKSIGKVIKKYRKRRGLSQEALAEKAGVHKLTICRYETGKHSPSSGTIIKICKALDVEMWKFIYDVSKEGS